MKRFVRLLAYALASFVLAVLWLILTPDSLAYNLVSGVLFLVATYVLYRAVMSLSPLGRVEKDVATTTAAGGPCVNP